MMSLKAMIQTILDTDVTTDLAPEVIERFARPFRLLTGNRPDKEYYKWLDAFKDMIVTIKTSKSKWGVWFNNESTTIAEIGGPGVVLWSAPSIQYIYGEGAGKQMPPPDYYIQHEAFESILRGVLPGFKGF